jgi:type VI protein secretion system component Hcp
MKATKRTNAAGTKSKGMKKGKSLEPVKPLTKIAATPATSMPAENISFNYGNIAWTYTQQK